MINNTQKKVFHKYTEDFDCPSCGGMLRFDGKKDKFLCTSCGYEGNINAVSDRIMEYSFADYEARERRSVPFAGLSVVICKNCGCKITFDEQLIATVCPMCDSAQVDIEKPRTGIPPEGIIPFKVNKLDAEQKFHKWIKGLWFAPTILKKSVSVGTLTGKFIPFWTYDAEVIAPYTGQGSMKKTVKNSKGEEKTVTEWYHTNGIVSQCFNDVAVCAVGGDSASEVETVGPFDTIYSLKPFASEYLAGYHAEIYSIKADAGFEIARMRMNITMKNLAVSDICTRFDSARSVRVNPKYIGVTYKHVLLPIWSSHFTFNGKNYRYLINGETGVLSGSRPYSALKILRAIAIVATSLAILYAIFFV